MCSLFPRVFLSIIVILLLVSNPVRAEEPTGQALVGLDAIRLHVVSAKGLDPVDVEVCVLKRLAAEGIVTNRQAAAVLAVDAYANDSVAGAGVSVLQDMVLERDPMVSVQVATWTVGESERLTFGGDPERTSLYLVDRIMGQFLAAWTEVNR